MDLNSPNLMNGLVWTAPLVMELQPLPVPVPAADEVLIHTSIAGICGSELGGFLGKNSLRVPPLVMGHEAVGVIAHGAKAVLADGSPAREGLRVTFNPLITCNACELCLAGLTNLCPKRQLIGAHRPGAYAEYVAVPARQCWPLDPQISDAMGSLAEPLAFAVRSVGHFAAADNASLLILGAGTIGALCLAVARHKGFAQIAISDTQQSRLNIARQWGASHVIDASVEDTVQIARQLEPTGFSCVIDAVGSDLTRSQALKTIRPGGTVVFAGLHAEESPLAINYLIRQEIGIKGSFAYSENDFKSALHLLHEGLIPAEGTWIEERPLAQGQQAFEDLIHGRSSAIKILLRTNGSAATP